MGALYRAIYAANRAWDRNRTRLRRKIGWSRPPVIIAHRGFGTHHRAVVRARVLEDRGALHFEDRSTLGRLGAAYRRYATWKMPNEPVLIRWNEREVETKTDREGYVEQWIQPPASAHDGWNFVDIELPRYDCTTRGSVLVTGPRAEFAVLSDIDDTIIETGATNPIKRAYALFWADTRTRLPFEGVAAFYRALWHGKSGDAKNPMLYLSSSPWNLHQHLEVLLERHDIPDGAMLLRDWGFGPEGFAPTGGHGHKVAKAAEVFDVLDPLPLVLIGDSGQEDAQHYATLVEQHPERVRAVYIRDLGAHDRRVDEAVERMRAQGVPVLLASDTAAAAEHAGQIGLLDARCLEDVRRDRDEDRERTGVVDHLGAN